MRASLATIWSSQGRKGAPRAEAAERPVGLDEAVLRGVLGVGGVAGDEVRGAEGDPLVCLHDLLVRVHVAALGALDELALLGGRPSTVPVLHRRRVGGSVVRRSRVRGLSPDVARGE